MPIFSPQQHVRLTFEGHFQPQYSQEAQGNRLLLDELGGCRFFGIPRRLTELDKGSLEEPYPSDDVILSASQHCQIFAVHEA